MKRSITFYAIAVLAAMCSCSSNQVAEARIFERKEQPGNKLLIKYQYLVDGRQYSDSATINNRVLDGDTITVKYSSSDPARAIPEVNESRQQ